MHRRHDNYLDSLPDFMHLLGLDGAQTDEMVPLIYPYFSLYGDIEDNLDYVKLLEFSTHLLSKLDRYDLTKIKNDSIFDQKIFIRDAKAGIKDEIINIQDLILVINFIVGLLIPEGFQELAADINSDQLINIQDIILLINISGMFFIFIIVFDKL